MRSDYDSDPARYRAGVQTVERYGTAGDVHPDVARRIMAQHLTPTLDLACGEGRLSLNFPDDHPPVSFDYSPTMLRKVVQPKVRGDGSHLPFADGSFGSVAALWCLYHFEDVREVLREVKRVLRPGGLLAACASARDSHPELSHLLTRRPSTFDAEEAESVVAELFPKVEVERWDGPFVELPDQEAVSTFLRGMGLPAADVGASAKMVKTPVSLTMRGCLVWGQNT